MNSALGSGDNLVEGSIAHAAAAPGATAARTQARQKRRSTSGDSSPVGGTLELAAAASTAAEGRGQATDSLVHRAKPWGVQPAPVVQTSDYTERWIKPQIGGVLEASFHDVTVQVRAAVVAWSARARSCLLLHVACPSVCVLHTPGVRSRQREAADLR